MLVLRARTLPWIQFYRACERTREGFDSRIRSSFPRRRGGHVNLCVDMIRQRPSLPPPRSDPLAYRAPR